jgi:hypothetical protein
MKKLICQRCAHQWFKRQVINPKVCPKCKRTDWSIRIENP